jgi:hypothetical protein
MQRFFFVIMLQKKLYKMIGSFFTYSTTRSATIKSKRICKNFLKLEILEIPGLLVTSRKLSF